MTKVTNLWRHPIKSHGREALDEVIVAKHKTMPFDRVWGVLHESAKVDVAKNEWAPCANFSRGSKAPKLVAIHAVFNEAKGEIKLTHPERPDLTFQPDVPQQAAEFIKWVTPICPGNRALPASLYKVPDRGLTDSPYPSISINSHSSLRALNERAGFNASDLRFRGNVWLDGFEPWSEFDWIGKEIEIGEAILEIREPIERCLATTANPETGERDLDTLKHLNEDWGHQDFGVYAVVVKGGLISVGDKAKV